jgi:arylsulfatase A-like enzyme
MDWLARTGARFDNAFTPCPVCSPARACFWTGKMPSAHGVHDHLARREHPGLTGQENLGEILQRAGYRTGLCGKWHCHAHGDVAQPGFDHWFSQWGGTKAVAGPQPFSLNGQRKDPHGQQAPLITDSALQFLRDTPPEGEQPFFLFVGFTDTHAPFTSLPERLVEHYRSHDFRELPKEQTPDALRPRHKTYFTLPDDPARRHEEHAQYYAAVSMIDEQMGRVLDELEARGQLDDTLIIYTSDHGHMNGQHGLVTKGNASVPQNLLDDSIKIPLLMRWPGRVDAGVTPPEPVDHCDLHATLAELAGARHQESAARPGSNMLPLPQHASREEAAGKWRDFQVCEYGNARCARTERFKLIRRYPGAHGRFPDEFYDLQRDPRENTNRLHEPRYAEEIARLDEILQNHFARYGAAENSGIRVLDLPRCNGGSPWEIDVAG